MQKQECKHEWVFKEKFDDDGSLLELECACKNCKIDWKKQIYFLIFKNHYENRNNS